MIWLKLRIKSLRLRRHGVQYADDDTVKVVIAKELRTSQQLLGYRSMWKHIINKYGLKVKRYQIDKHQINKQSRAKSSYDWFYRSTVMSILKELDPEGVAARKSRRLKRRIYYSKVSTVKCFDLDWCLRFQGPNFVWHMDGYDKLSPYGLAIHGCIDG